MKTSLLHSSLAASLFLAACGGDVLPPQTPGPAGSVAARAPEPTVRPEPTQAPPESRRAPPTSEPLAKPSTVSCTLSTTTWQQGTIKLRFDGTSEPFATVNRPRSYKASLPKGPEPILVELDVDAAIVSGYVEAADVALYSADAIPLRDAFVLLPGVALKWEGADVDQVKFSIPIDKKRAVPADGSLEASKPCSYFSLDKKDFQPLRATASDSSRRTAIRPGKYELTNEAIGGKVVARIDSDASAPYAVLLASQGTKTRIAWKVGDAVVYGWIDTKFTAANPETLQTGEWSRSPPFPPPPVRNTSFDAWKKVTCSTDAPLIAEVGDKRRIVGHVKAGKVAQIGPERGGFLPITLPESDLLSTDRAKLFVPADSGCK